ncbi:MAG: hypothetical protein OSJ65_07950 [Bacilli bacterium]|nr:hypothetical protein [Bacilli bacterium]
MRLKKELLALSLALLIGNSMTAEAHSKSELIKIHNKIEKYLDIEVSANDQYEDDNLNYYFHVQALVHSVPTDRIDELFTSLVDTIESDDLIKDYLKNSIDKNMYCSAKESIIFANTAENKQELYCSICTFMDSRYNGNAFEKGMSMLKEYFPKEDIHVLNNQSGKLNIPKTVFVFMDYSSYEDYRVYTKIYEDGYYYFITNQENDLLAYFVDANQSFSNTNYSYNNLSNKGFTISNIEDFLNDNNKSDLLSDNYTYEELSDLGNKLADSDQIKRGLCPKN